jgi:hypothetical protein
MKRVYLSVILLCAVVNSGFSQEVKPDFVQTLAEFKYSLYADLAPIPVENFDILSFNNNDKIVEKIATFISDNKAGIIAHRESILARLSHKIPAVEGYKTKEGFKPVIDMFPLEFLATSGKALPTFFEFFSIEPLYSVNYIITLTFSQMNGAKSTGAFVIGNTIAAPKISTVALGSNKWKVYVDYYRKIFELNFDTTNGQVSLMNYLVRE